MINLNNNSYKEIYVYSFMSNKDYPNSDLEASLKRAFVNKGFDSILMDGRVAQNEFLRDGVNYGIKQGWLKLDHETNESQYTAMAYVLTAKGKKHFGLS